MLALNDVVAIFLFGVLCGIVFSTGNLTHQLLQGPVGIVMGCVFGAVAGLCVLRLPSDNSVRSKIFSISNTKNLFIRSRREFFSLVIPNNSHDDGGKTHFHGDTSPSFASIQRLAGKFIAFFSSLFIIFLGRNIQMDFASRPSFSAGRCQ